jgi:1,4-dihydroxy-6-naphthoate synthase
VERGTRGDDLPGLERAEMTLVRMGISTCPNDTFAFHGLLSGRVDPCGLDLRLELADVEELNQRTLAGELDASKVSFHAALHLAQDYVVLPCGSAIGFGVGPLLLAARPGEHPSDTRFADRAARVLCPGAHTTASLLYELFHPGQGRVEQVLFSEIMPALAAGRADFGVCIHEGRFTFAEQGLDCVQDLGERWEAETGAPLPLGGLVARRSLGTEVLKSLTRAIRNSLDHAIANRAEAFSTMRQHAQELDDDVIGAHVDLYVNAWTRDLGQEGQSALDALSVRAPATDLPRIPLEIFDA